MRSVEIYGKGDVEMPTEEELEQRVTDSLDDRQKELMNARAVIRKLDSERLDEIFAKAVKPE